MKRLAMVIDVDKCTGCFNCFLACRDEYAGNEYLPYSAAQPISAQDWMQVKEIERGHYPRPKVFYEAIPCMHCEDAPCMAAAENGAVYRREDGIVLIDPEKAEGQRDLVASCPYRAIFWNEERGTAQKCTMCAHRMDEGAREPRCAQACPTGAIVFGDLSDPESAVAKAWDKAEAMHAEFGTNPLVRYLGLPGHYVQGEVVLGDRQDVCASGVTLTLEGSEGTMTAVTKTFGDFEFGRLPVNETYTVKVSHPGYVQVNREVITRGDVDLGEIVLVPLK